ncbi:uncharacterized protein [Diabrotica undecimpunctata]|uniref:uncharacterized protein n=1 Tax=Diabrotica undecimpunctata TaxID=50387 RepID=UPI003B635399
MKFLATLFIAFAVLYSALSIPQFSIGGSNVPDIRYELKAVEALKEAYELYPNDALKRVEAFSDLFGEVYPITNGWNVVSACDTFYTNKERIYVDIIVKESELTADNTTDTTIKIFS